MSNPIKKKFWEMVNQPYVNQSKNAGFFFKR